MSHRTPAEWHALAAELERLLAEGQATPIRLLLQARFLREIQGESESVWSAFGFPVALAFARSAEGDLARCGETFLEELEETLRTLDGHRAPPWTRDEDWAGGLAAARGALAREQDALKRTLGGETPLRERGEESAKPTLGTESLLVPVILQVQSSRAVPEFFRSVRASCLIRLTVEAQLLYRRARAAELTLSGAADPETVAGFEEAVRLLGRASTAGTPSLGHYWFRVRWDLAGARLTGRSATLGFLLAAQSAQEQYSLAFGHRGLAGGVAVTGDLRAEETVEVESIREKVQACFYGGVRVVVVPASQRDEAVREVHRLGERHPGRQLLVLGASRVSEFRHEPAVAVVRMRTGRELLRTMMRRIAVSRALVAALVGIFGILAGLGARELWLQRPWPVEIRWEREQLVFRNASGRDYHRLSLPPGASPEEIGTFQRRAGRVASACDLGGGTTNEAVAICWNPGFEGNTLRAWSGRGHALWGLSSQAELEGSLFGSEPLNWRCFVEARRSRSEVGALLAMRRSRYGSLSLLERIDPTSGSRLGALANRGHLGLFLHDDVDGDGEGEILTIGTENREEAGILAILDPERVDLPLPRGNGEPVWLTQPAALEHGVRAVFLFPRDRLRPFGRPDCVDGQMESGLLRITTETERPGRVIIFSLDLREISRPVAVGALLNDSYRHQLLASGFGASAEETAAEMAAKTAVEENRLARAISYLTPEGWRPVPFIGESGEIRSAEGTTRD